MNMVAWPPHSFSGHPVNDLLMNTLTTVARLVNARLSISLNHRYYIYISFHTFVLNLTWSSWKCSLLRDLNVQPWLDAMGTALMMLGSESFLKMPIFAGVRWLSACQQSHKRASMSHIPSFFVFSLYVCLCELSFYLYVMLLHLYCGIANNQCKRCFPPGSCYLTVDDSNTLCVWDQGTRDKLSKELFTVFIVRGSFSESSVPTWL